MKELLWIKSLNDKEHARLMREESDARIKKLEELDKVWAEIQRVLIAHEDNMD